MNNYTKSVPKNNRTEKTGNPFTTNTRGSFGQTGEHNDEFGQENDTNYLTVYWETTGLPNRGARTAKADHTTRNHLS
jgi:hypothetical protein